MPAITSAAPEGPRLALPIACKVGQSCVIQSYVDRDPGPSVRDYRCGRRTYEGHTGIDFRVLDMAAQRRGVDVLAAAPGRVARIRDGVQDISIRAPSAPGVKGQECGNGVVLDHGGGWETQYCHVARTSVRVRVGDEVAAGAPLARVGLSGNTEFPHLHFVIRKDGKVVDPFGPAPDQPPSCASQPPMWTPEAMRQLVYNSGAVLNAGFSSGPVSMEDVEGGQVASATAQGPYLVAYVRAIGLQAGDRIELALTGPNGAALAANRLDSLNADKAQYLAYVGKKRPPAGWPRGVYTGSFRVIRAGKLALEKTLRGSL
jgi:hypothetical protein